MATLRRKRTMAHWLRLIPESNILLITERASHTLRWKVVGTFNPATDIIVKRTPGRGKHTVIHESRVYQITEQIDAYTYRARRVE